MHTAILSNDTSSLAVADMITIAFYFLLRPGEYTGNPSDTTPFRLRDVALFVGAVRLDLRTASNQDIATATFATLEFTTQKNGVRGEVVGLGRSGDPHFCPVAALTSRVLHLKQHGAPSDTNLAMYHYNIRWQPVRPSDVTHALRLAATVLGPTYGFLPSDISARSLRAAGAMALLCAKVDHDTIRLIGRWRSDEMFRYLHVQAAPVMHNFSSRMLRDGTFSLHPSHQVPLS